MTALLRLRARIEAESGHLDVLVNNAGVALDSNISPSQVNLDMVRNTFEVNVFGCIRVTQAFMPLLKRSAARADCHGKQ